MAFFQFRQNNSEGVFIENDTVCHRLFVEADTHAEADKQIPEADLKRALILYERVDRHKDEGHHCADRGELEGRKAVGLEEIYEHRLASPKDTRKNYVDKRFDFHFLMLPINLKVCSAVAFRLR